MTTARTSQTPRRMRSETETGSTGRSCCTRVHVSSETLGVKNPVINCEVKFFEAHKLPLVPPHCINHFAFSYEHLLVVNFLCFDDKLKELE